MKQNNQTIYIVGPTASGKSNLAIKLAQKYNGEIISADSRQIYRGLDIGSGKEPGRLTHSTQRGLYTKTAYMIGGIPHYMIDTHHPNTVFNIAKFIRRAKKIQEDIIRRGKIPIVCGGTMFWAQGLLEGATFPEVLPNDKLRAKLTKKSTKALFELLETKDIGRAHDIRRQNAQNNRMRIIRALEIIAQLGKVPTTTKIDYSTLNNENLIIAINHTKEVLHKRIEKRMLQWFDTGIFEEIKKAHADMHVPWVRIESFGLEYKWCTQYVRQHISFDVMQERTIQDLKKYAKRQMTWLRRWEKSGAHIHHITTLTQADVLTKKFLKKK